MDYFFLDHKSLVEGQVFGLELSLLKNFQRSQRGRRLYMNYFLTLCCKQAMYSLPVISSLNLSHLNNISFFVGIKYCF